MIRAINNIHTDKSKVLLRLDAQSTIARLKIDRTESSFGGKASLTQAEIQQSLELAHQVRKRTAW